MPLIIESEHLEATRDGRVYTIRYDFSQRGNRIQRWYDIGWNVGSLPRRFQFAVRDFMAGVRDGRDDL